MNDNSVQKPVSPNAVISLVLGLATLALIPFLSLVSAPCGFPLSLLTGISAIIIGGKGKKEIPGGGRLAAAGILTGWAGIAVNTLLMLLKLAMFVVIIIIPILVILHAGKAR